jgi:hypothetical protein
VEELPLPPQTADGVGVLSPLLPFPPAQAARLNIITAASRNKNSFFISLAAFLISVYRRGGEPLRLI